MEKLLDDGGDPDITDKGQKEAMEAEWVRDFADLGCWWPESTREHVRLMFTKSFWDSM